MDKFDYAEARNDAKELIAEFGQTMTISKPDGSQKQTFTGVFLDISHKDRQNSLLLESAGKVITADVLKRDSTDDGDRVTIGTNRYAVLSTDVLSPGGSDVYYTLYLRK